MKTIHTTNAPQPAGHYAQAIVHNGFVFVSGQLPVNPERNEKVMMSVEDQTLQVLRNLEAILEASGSSLSKVVKVTVYISDIDLWGRVNQVYTRFMGAHKPARVVVPVKELHYGYNVELDAIAATD